MSYCVYIVFAYYNFVGDCPLPPNVKFSNPWFFIDDRITIQDENCPRGYVSSSKDAITCLSSGQWSKSIDCVKGTYTCFCHWCFLFISR